MSSSLSDIDRELSESERPETLPEVERVSPVRISDIEPLEAELPMPSGSGITLMMEV